MIFPSFAGRMRLDSRSDTEPFVQEMIVRLRPRLFEAFVVVFAVASVIEPFVTDGVHHPVLDAILSLFWSLPYLARERNPAAPPLVAAAALAVFGVVEGAGTQDLTLPFIAAILTASSSGALADPRMRIAGWSAIVGAAAVVNYRSSSAAADFFWTTLILSLAWFFGVALASRTAQTRELRERVATVERERTAAAERAAAEERSRIARELHDVVAHSVSVMVVQASGVRRLLHADQEREREALLSVEHIGREALAEMRRMLGVMRAGEEKPAELAPQPGLLHLDRLIAQVEEAGLPVRLRVEGDRPELPIGIDLSAYRIVQEGLTNTLKHAPGAQAEVVIRYGENGVEVEVMDDGAGAANGSRADGGHGLVGMRERVALYGGSLDAGPRDGGGFVLRAQLPVGERS
jgi:signal transduction histidine kinase